MHIFKFILLFVLTVLTLPSIATTSELATAQDSSAQATAPADAVFGPVQAEDTLWNIAKGYRNSAQYLGPRPDSLYPVMYGIYLKNPHAFIDDNVSHLRNGVMLEMPSADFVASLDLGEAERKIEGDDKQWTSSIVEQQIIHDIQAQYADSLSTIQTLLTENQRLTEQLERVAEQVDVLNTQVTQDVQAQLQEQATLQAHLLTLINNPPKVQSEADSSQWVEDFKVLLTEPLVVVAVLSLTVFTGFIVFGLWLFRKQQPDVVKPQAEPDSDGVDTEALDTSHSPEFLDVDVLLSETEEVETTAQEPDLDVLKNIEGIPVEVPAEEQVQDDELASDLDLARTYIEMGETDEAVSLLEEVLQHGSTAQQAEANDLLAQLDNNK
ncbi:MAG: FimV/HubP family polar landmark protein [Glaciecola sp.]|jgi:pilus assembly protein FimV